MCNTFTIMTFVTSPQVSWCPVAGGAIVYQNRRFENVSGKVKRRRQKQAAAGAV
jgi:adenine-specific DNA glycosylase